VRTLSPFCIEKQDSLYLPSVERTDQDSVLISKEDIAQLSDGKKSILSALLPKGSLVIDSVLGEGMHSDHYNYLVPYLLIIDAHLI